MSDIDPSSIIQSWALPSRPLPVVQVGMGGIVKDAHLPAYRLAGIPSIIACDLDLDRARNLATLYGIEKTVGTVEEAVSAAPEDAVYDVAIPCPHSLPVLEQLPDGATVLIQKPMGNDLAEATAIRDLCRRKEFTAAVNHQLRFAPQCLAARDLIARGVIGEVHAMEVRMTIYTPWHLWKILEGLPRVEVQVHTVHYLDLIRSFLGEPGGVYCRTTRHPSTPRLASVRTHAILDYGDEKMVGIQVNHNHAYGPRHQESFIKWEGTTGAIKTTLGSMVDYPDGVPDTFEYATTADRPEGQADWHSVPLQGSWLPEAFIGPMANLQRYRSGEEDTLHASIDDVYQTMQLVEACYRSNEQGAVPVP